MRPFTRITPARGNISRSIICQRPFSFSPQSRLKEDKPQTPEQIEKAKQEQLRDGKKKDDLKSSSETVVEAEKSDKGPEQLQKETAQQAQQERASK